MTAAMLASLVLNYDNLSDPKYLLKLGVIIQATKGNPEFGVFPEHGSPEKLEEKYNQLKIAFEGARDKSRSMIKLRNATRKETDGILYTMGHHIQSHCQGNEESLRKSGYDLRIPRGTGSIRTLHPPAQPSGWVVEQGASTQLTFKMTPTRGAVFCEIWCTEGDPSIEENWQYKGGFPEFEGVLTGFKKGARYSLRARLVGKAGAGDWTNTISIVVE